ncbi:MAG: amidohydrolase family protein, partial [Oscillospiraceae bacterium]|nr:amidohydrolase family protein [Oscillospiraceae bacterium]
IEKARAEGMDVTADAYAYPAGSTTILSLIPPTVPLEGIDTPEGIALLEREISREHEGWDNMVLSIGWERIVLSSFVRPEHRIYAGKTLTEAAALMGVSSAGALAALTAQNGGKVGVILMSMSEEDVELVLRQPWVSVISDALYGGGDCPHPRLYGAFPRMLSEYVKNRGLMPLEEAVRKMTALPARRIGLTDRGLLKEGMAADICVFDPSAVQDTATFTEPVQMARGFSLVLVDGEKAVENDQVTGVFAGGVLRRGR